MGAIFKGLEKVILTCKPDGAAIEKIFYHKNAESALKLGQARGAALTALAMQNLDVAEYSARQVKQAVVGYGAAAKGQVQTMVKALLDLKDLPEQDAADALAIAKLPNIKDFYYAVMGQAKVVTQYDSEVTQLWGATAAF